MRRYRPGEWLVKDEESGFTEYASKVTRDYWGVLTKNPDPMHPQMFVRAKDDPYPVPYMSPPLREYDKTWNITFYIDSTLIQPVQGPATHLFYPGVGDAEIEYDLFVY